MWGTFISRLLIKGLIMLIQSRLKENVKSNAVCQCCLIILSRFDVIGLRYVLDQIMKRLPCFFTEETQCCVYLMLISAWVWQSRGEAIAWSLTPPPPLSLLHPTGTYITPQIWTDTETYHKKAYFVSSAFSTWYTYFQRSLGIWRPTFEGICDPKSWIDSLGFATLS